ncbi:MAG: hypothetical protein ACRECH_16130 [Nitrososphaerales archaeon]
MKVEYQEYTPDDWWKMTESRREYGVKSPKVYNVHYENGDTFFLRCFYCGDIAGLGGHQQSGMIHIENGIVDISGAGACSIGGHGHLDDSAKICPAHYHIYKGEVVLDCGWSP